MEADKVINAVGDVNGNHYRLNFRCSNCGTIFEFDLQKGNSVNTMKGICPYCGVRSGTAGVGTFEVIKLNGKFDEVQRHYFK